MNMTKNNLLKHRTGVTYVLLLLILLLSLSVTFAFFTDYTSGNINFCTVSAVDHNYTLSGSINNSIETTVTDLEDDNLLVIHEKNLEGRALFSQVTLTASWKGDNNIEQVHFTDSATGRKITPVIDNKKGTVTITLPENIISANGMLTHKLDVMLTGDIEKDTLQFAITSDVSSVKGSWAETVGPVELKLHTAFKYPIKLEVASTSEHRDTYLVGDDFDSTDLVLTVTYDTGETAEITYKASEDCYYIDKGDGKGKIALSGDEFVISNITDMQQIKFDDPVYDATLGGSGVSDTETITFTYKEGTDSYAVHTDVAYNEWIDSDIFLTDFINSGKYNITLNGSAVTGGGSGANKDGTGNFTFKYYSSYKEYLVQYAYSYDTTVSAADFQTIYMDSGHYKLTFTDNNPIYPLSGTYPHASYTENDTTVACDIVIKVGDAVIQSWDMYDETDFHAYRDTITAVEFLETYNPPAGLDTASGYGPWDVSENKNESVMAYMVPTGSTVNVYDYDAGAYVDVPAYKVYICSNVGKAYDVIANENSGNIFYAFEEITSVKGTDNLNTSSAKDMSYMFGYCESLTGLDLSTWDVSKVESLQWTFAGCHKLRQLDVSDWVTPNLKDMSGTFYDCWEIASLNLEGWDVSNVTTMRLAFGTDFNSALTTIGDVSKWNTESLQDMWGMFYGAYNLKTVPVADWNTSNVTDMGSVFYWCTGLETLDVSKWKTGNVTSMEDMFNSCDSLKTIDISNWNCSALVYGAYDAGNDGMFKYCDALTALTIPKTMKQLETQFAYGCENLTTITFKHTAADSLTFATAGGSGPFYVYQSQDGDTYYNADHKLKTMVITNNDTIKDTVYNHLWKNEHRSLLYDVAVTDAEGITINQNTTGLQAWAYYPTDLSFTFKVDDGYEFVHWEISYTDLDGTSQFFEVEKDNLATFVMPYADIQLTPVCEITKVPVKLEVSVSPNETYYIPGEDYNPTGVEFTVTYDDNSTATITYKASEDAYYIDKGNGKGKVLLDDLDFEMTHIKNLAEAYLYTPAVDYKKGGTGLDYNGDPFTFTYNEITGYYVVSFEDAGPYNIDESYFINYYVGDPEYTIYPNDQPAETMVGTFPHAAYTENDVTVECDVVITVAAPVLKNTYGYLQSTVSILDNTELLSYLDSDTLRSVEFKDSMDGLDKETMDYADVSEKQNGSVIAWVDGDTLYVGGKQGVFANASINGLFSDTFRGGYNHYYDDITSIDVTNLIVLGENDNGYPVTTDMCKVFYGCDALTTIIGLENWNTASVTDMSGMFGKTAISKITGVADWDTSNVESMSSMFDEDKNLIDVSELSKWDTSNVQSMRYMFSKCSSLTNVPMDNWDCSSIVGDWSSSNDGMFEDCILLEELIIPATMKVLTNSFAMGCSSLDTITFLHDSDDELVIEDPGYLYGAFYVSTSADGSIKYWETPKVTNIHLPNDTTGALKELLSARVWADDNRTPSFGTATLSLDLNGGNVLY